MENKFASIRTLTTRLRLVCYSVRFKGRPRKTPGWGFRTHPIRRGRHFILFYFLYIKKLFFIFFSGQISLRHVIFFGIGGYTSSFFYVEYGISPWIGIIIGILFSSLVAIAIGIPMLRLSGHYFAIATLLIGFSFQIIFQRWDLIGAASGLWISLNWDNTWISLQFHESKIPYYYIFLIVFLYE